VAILCYLYALTNTSHVFERLVAFLFLLLNVCDQLNSKHDVHVYCRFTIFIRWNISSHHCPINDKNSCSIYNIQNHVSVIEITMQQCKVILVGEIGGGVTAKSYISAINCISNILLLPQVAHGFLISEYTGPDACLCNVDKHDERRQVFYFIAETK
jgi:hypothetical protein